MNIHSNAGNSNSNHFNGPGVKAGSMPQFNLNSFPNQMSALSNDDPRMRQLNAQAQQQLQNLNHFQNLSLDAADMLSFGGPRIVVKNDLSLDPSDPFAITSDFGDLSGVLGPDFANINGAGGLGGFSGGSLDPNSTSLMSPLSNSPLMDDIRGSASLESSYPSTPIDNFPRFQPPTPVASLPFRQHNQNFGKNSISSSAANSSTATPSGSLPGLSVSMNALKPLANQGVPVSSGPTSAILPPTTAGTLTHNTPATPSDVHFYSMSVPVGKAGFASHENSLKTSNPFVGSLPGGSAFTSTGPSSSLPSGGSKSRKKSTVNDDDDAKSRQSDLLSEKRRRRRESHNAVERRRRDQINERINELSSLLPDFAADAQNKGAILGRSVEYIKMMQALATRQQERMVELENIIRRLLMQTGIQEHELMLTVPLGTVFELPQMPPMSSERMTAPGGARRETTEGSDLYDINDDYA
ncbi:hypothetical protein HDV05_004811 [Chytridiales sp. JEL 0842]|nr:hypothetical protein HDV05_004811 [Chytridiales sp. JEL 0842]